MRISVRQLIKDKFYLKHGEYTLTKDGKDCLTLIVRPLSDSVSDTPRKTPVSDTICEKAYTPPDPPFTAKKAKEAPTGLSDFQHYSCGCQRGVGSICPIHKVSL